jgi:hypothetical protein
MCQPVSQPCNNTTNTSTKIYQLKAATKKMLTKLQAVSATAGDVRVGIVPFNRAIDVGTTNVGASWIDWTDWEAPPANAGTISSDVGPGSDCPFSTGTHGWNCRENSTNGASRADDNEIPNTGLICPGIDSGAFNTDHRDRYYNGCWDSVPTVTKTTGNSTTNTVCDNKSSCTVANYCSDYPKTSTSGNTTTTTTCECHDSNWSGTRHTCTRTSTPVTTTTGKPYTHTWIVNDRATWGGCIMDRDKTSNYDISNTTAVGFPAANLENPLSSTNCMHGDVMELNYNWTDLAARVDAMQARGSTNQAIGVVHGWQMLTPGAPYNTPSVPANTTRYIILFSDGLNTQNRWWGDGSTEGTTEDGYIDDRMDLACSAAKADGVIIYTL